jgi:dTDP-4-amino-4,6-dideoxygalactose transaminase
MAMSGVLASIAFEGSMAVARQRIHLPPGAWRRALSGALTGSLWKGGTVAGFEKAFAEFMGVPDAVAVPSGRAGLRFIFQALNLEPGAEVICSAFGYPVVPHLAKSLGYRLKLADCEWTTLGMDPDALAKTISSDTKLVIATHLYGVPCRIREIAEIVERSGAVLVEDCAHCFGAAVSGKRAGSFGSFGYFSFETSKPINTMGGGMVTVRDAATAKRLREIAAAEPGKNFRWLLERLLKTTFEATVTHPIPFQLGVYPALRLASKPAEEMDRFASGYQRDEVTMKGRMGAYTNYQAGLGISQMERAVELLETRNAHARRLMERLRGKVQFQTNEAPDVACNFMLVTAMFPKMRETAAMLLREGVDTKYRYMRDCTGLLEDGSTFPMASRAEREVLHIPAYPELPPARIDWIAERIGRVVDRLEAGAPAPSPLPTSGSRERSGSS